MRPVEIKKDIYWVGAIDWNVRNFHGHTYSTKRGTTYNSYLIKDKKICLVDTVLSGFTRELIENIKAVVRPSEIDYIVANHVETDHSGALPELKKLCRKATVIGTEKCREGLYKNYFEEWDFKTVKTGDSISLGERTLSFFEAPMVHWPDSMFSYCPQEKLLFPNDAFGQHYATAERFDDQIDQSVLMDEAKRYYANILWPLGSIILKKIEEFSRADRAIDMVAPSHGIIWRKDPKKIISSYVDWASQSTENKVVIVYETMWQATAQMARLISEGITDAGVSVKVFDINAADKTDVISEMLDAKGFILGSSTHDNGMLPNIAGFLELLKGFKPKSRLAAVFGSYGWAGGAVKEIEGLLGSCGIRIFGPSLSVKYMPDETEKKRCYEFGMDFAKEFSETE